MTSVHFLFILKIYEMWSGRNLQNTDSLMTKDSQTRTYKIPLEMKLLFFVYLLYLPIVTLLCNTNLPTQCSDAEVALIMSPKL